MKDDPDIPMHIVQLIVGHFHQTLTEKEKDELDEWICANDENMKVFEECLEKTLLPKQPCPDADEITHAMWIAAELLIKDRQHTLNAQEKEALQEWLSQSGERKKLIKFLPKTHNQKELYQWLLKWKEDRERRNGLN